MLRDQVTVVDLGMLTDRTIAETLGEGSNRKDVPRFHEYILSHRKPLFMELRAYHSWIAQFDADPRFRRDYTAIREYHDTWIRGRYGKDTWSGDYVRRDAVGNRPDILRQIQTEAASLYYPFCEVSGHVEKTESALP